MLLEAYLRVANFLAQTPTPGVNTPVPPETTHFQLDPVRWILMSLYLMVCIGLIAVVMQTEQKQGGLQGMLGGGSSPLDHKYQGKKSYEENLKTVSNYLAIAFIGLSIIISYVMQQ